MFKLSTIGLVLSLAITCQCQRYDHGGDGGESANLIYRQQKDDYSNYQNTPVPPQILTHKQALNHDGNFKYLFTSENGLAQGETISPDGSRNGGYSYVDPTGRKITVKYTAGKEGFRILEADHLPKAPQPVAPLPVPQAQPQQASYLGAQGYNRQQDDGQYRPAQYEAQNQVARYLSLANQPQARAAYPTPIAAGPTPHSNALGEREPDYNDEPGKANSFGTGYIFEFSG